LSGRLGGAVIAASIGAGCITSDATCNAAPRAGGQLFSCGCVFDEDAIDDDDIDDDLLNSDERSAS
jgi:hypothetical protein